MDKEIRKWDEPDGEEEYDLTFVGFPVHKFGPDESQRGFLKKYTKGKKVALFITHAMPPEAPMAFSLVFLFEHKSTVQN